jgi:hypothetical protein
MPPFQLQHPCTRQCGLGQVAVLLEESTHFEVEGQPSQRNWKGAASGTGGGGQGEVPVFSVRCLAGYLQVR